jgi:hypothetical protein
VFNCLLEIEGLTIGIAVSLASSSIFTDNFVVVKE